MTVSLLVATTLYPNSRQPRHGIFVHTRIKQLLAGGEFQAEVVAPVPWFPFKMKSLPRYSVYSDVPKEEMIDGIRVHHPRYLVIPKIGMLLTPFTLAFAFLHSARRLRASGHRFDLVDAHYFYPDGVAVALASNCLKLPFAITARGTDINLIPDYRLPRRMIIWAARRADACITVCQALADGLEGLGVSAERIHVMRNGVDLQMFAPQPREDARERYKCSMFTIASVGNLVELKGHHLVIKALHSLPDCQLLIVGGGEQEHYLRNLVVHDNLCERVEFLGTLDQPELIQVYSAADVLVLASSREGLANVLLEAMACGSPVVATAVSGTPEVVQSPEAGVLIYERSIEAVVDGIKQLRASLPARAHTREYASRFDWSNTVLALSALFLRLVSKSPNKKAA